MSACTTVQSCLSAGQAALWSWQRYPSMLQTGPPIVAFFFKECFSFVPQIGILRFFWLGVSGVWCLVLSCCTTVPAVGCCTVCCCGLLHCMLLYFILCIVLLYCAAVLLYAVLFLLCAWSWKGYSAQCSAQHRAQESIKVIKSKIKNQSINMFKSYVTWCKPRATSINSSSGLRGSDESGGGDDVGRNTEFMFNRFYV